MAKHGEDKKLKRLNITKRLSIPKKEHVWAVKPSPGAHKSSESVALTSFLRDILRVAETYKEAKYLVTSGKVLINGRIIKDPKFPVSFMDVISLPSINMVYYLDLDNRGHFIAKREDARNFKLAKIIRKVSVKGNKIQYTLDDGHTFLGDNSYKVGDSLKVELPSYKVLSHLPFDAGASAVVLNGKHAGIRGRVKEIIPGTANARAKVQIDGDNGSVVTLKDYVFIEEGS